MLLLELLTTYALIVVNIPSKLFRYQGKVEMSYLELFNSIASITVNESARGRAQASGRIRCEPAETESRLPPPRPPVRGGFGLFYNRVGDLSWAGSGRGNPPFGEVTFDVRN